MGLRPWETDRLTPTQFNGMWKLWKRMNTRENEGSAAEEWAARDLTDAEIREAQDAERKFGGLQ
jgi:head-tail adaptor